MSQSDRLLAHYTRKGNNNSLSSKLIPPNYLYSSVALEAVMWMVSTTWLT